MSRRIATKPSVIALPVVGDRDHRRPTRTVATGAANGNLFTKRSGSAISATTKGRSQPGPLLTPSDGGATTSPSIDAGERRGGRRGSRPTTMRTKLDAFVPRGNGSQRSAPTRRHPAGRLSGLTSDALRYIVIQTQRKCRTTMTAITVTQSSPPERRPPSSPPEGCPARGLVHDRRAARTPRPPQVATRHARPAGSAASAAPSAPAGAPAAATSARRS